ncbi:MAG: YHS domain-containing protein [Proteobacteria bacterium]|nr:YHS domain-containing protein [Pseudomonadota bacterium]
MGLLRLLLLVGVGYILYRYLFGKRGSCSCHPKTTATKSDLLAGDILVEDPFCHTYVPQQGAESCTIAGTTYYFCSPECRKKFQSEPRSNA